MPIFAEPAKADGTAVVCPPGLESGCVPAYPIFSAFEVVECRGFFFSCLLKGYTLWGLRCAHPFMSLYLSHLVPVFLLDKTSWLLCSSGRRKMLCCDFNHCLVYSLPRLLFSHNLLYSCCYPNRLFLPLFILTTKAGIKRYRVKMFGLVRRWTIRRDEQL